MHIVAVYRLQGPPEELAGQLAGLLATTAYEMRSRVMAPGGGPAVVARFAEAGPATACAEALRQAGFAVLVIDSAAPVREPFPVHRLFLGTEGLRAVSRQEQGLEIPYAAVQLLVRGTGISTSSTTETSTERKFSLGRAVATGGLVMSKTQKTVTESTSEARESFCVLYAAGQPPLVLRQAAMDYQPFGADLKPTRDANFNWACSELRRRCGHAAWDERLQTRAGQVQLLGPGLPPEQYLDLAIRLLARALLADAG